MRTGRAGERGEEKGVCEGGYDTSERYQSGDRWSEYIGSVQNQEIQEGKNLHPGERPSFSN
eukprot:1350539-Amorphochlora_amoeboformis.AAC.1